MVVIKHQGLETTCSWVNSIKMDPKEDVEWTELDQGPVTGACEHRYKPLRGGKIRD